MIAVFTWLAHLLTLRELYFFAETAVVIWATMVHL